MGSLLSNRVNNIAHGIHKLNVNTGRMIKKYETCGIKCKDCQCFFEYTRLKDELIE